MVNDVITRATSWAMDGRRRVQIEIDTLSMGDGVPRIRMWAYDYDLTSGVWIAPGDPLPDMDALAREKAASLALELNTIAATLKEAPHGQTVR
ncbi:MAG: hypothetical protein EOL86_14760 [Deltaproteobacteria bacterium]|nr:hypothetical protein [Deltaproteobacteria bacterium]